MEFNDTVWEAGETYALVSFEGDTTAVVPVERVARGTVRDSSNGMVEGDECFVTWSNKKRYAAVFITAGSKDICEENQDALEALIQSSDEEEEINENEDKQKGNDIKGKKTRKRTKKANGGGKGKENEAKKQKENRGKEDDGFTMLVGDTPPRNATRVPLQDKTMMLNLENEELSSGVEVNSDAESSSVTDDMFEGCTNKHKVITIPVDGGHGSTTKLPKHYTGGKMEVQLEEISLEMTKMKETLKDTLKDYHTEQKLKFSSMELELAKVNTKLDSIKVTLAGVLAKELNPYLRTCTPTPTVVPMKTRPVPATTRSTEDIVNLIQAATRSTESTVNLIPTATRSTGNTINLIPTVTRPTVNQDATAARSTEDIVNLETRSTKSSANAVVSMPAMPILSSTFSGPTTLGGSPSTCATPMPSVGSSPTPSQPSHSPTPNNGLDIPLGRDITIDTSGQQLVSVPELTAIFNKSCSRRNMAVHLVRILFNEDIRIHSNVSGRCSKDMLDPLIIRYIKNICFQFFPLGGGEKRAEEWNKCIVAIDESNRRLKNKPRKTKSVVDET